VLIISPSDINRPTERRRQANQRRPGLAKHDLFPLVSSTSSTQPAAKRRASPSLAVTSHSPLSTKKILRVDEGCQSLDQPAGARMKPNCVAGVKKRDPEAAPAAHARRGQIDFDVVECDSPSASA